MFPASDDPLAEVMAAPVRVTPAPSSTPATFKDRCGKCAGTGRFGRFGQCFRCKGKGTIEHTTAPEVRAKRRAGEQARKQRAGDEALAAFKLAEPEVFAWMEGNPFPFAVAMVEAVRRWGSLTVNQLAACHRSIEKRDAARAAKVEAVAAAPIVNTTALAEAFAKSTRKAPKLIVGNLRISPAKADSANAGALYVKDRSTSLYLGKVMGGKFMRSRDCTDTDFENVVAVMVDPKAAAINSGRLTGTCAVCGRELTDAASIAAGIGPVCATGMGW